MPSSSSTSLSIHSPSRFAIQLKYFLRGALLCPSLKDDEEAKKRIRIRSRNWITYNGNCNRTLSIDNDAPPPNIFPWFQADWGSKETPSAIHLEGEGCSHYLFIVQRHLHGTNQPTKHLLKQSRQGQRQRQRPRSVPVCVGIHSSEILTFLHQHIVGGKIRIFHWKLLLNLLFPLHFHFISTQHSLPVFCLSAYFSLCISPPRGIPFLPECVLFPASLGCCPDDDHLKVSLPPNLWAHSQVLLLLLLLLHLSLCHSSVKYIYTLLLVL